MNGLLNDRYELGEIVGSGGMGAVYRAIDTRLGRTVAIKVLRGGALADDVARSRMRSEARLASSVHHPGIAQVFDYDASSTSHGGMSFIVMEFIDGQSLAQLLREHGPMPLDQVMSVVQQVADALAVAHAAGIVHRDLKPANIMLTPAGRTVLVDFGIASSPASEPLTETGTLLGTADYLSPEQAAGRSATPQSDLYALGVVAYHCLTGQSPFRRENSFATALAQVQDELPPLNQSVPARAQELIRSLAEKSPFDRPTSASDVALEASAIGATRAVHQPSIRTDQQGVAATDVFVETSALPLVARRTRRRRPVALYSGVGIVVAALLLFGVNRMGGADPQTVPDVVGLGAEKATDTLAADGLNARRTTIDSPGTPAGQVVRQEPSAGETPTGQAVLLKVSSGKVAVTAKDLIGTTYAKAAAALEKLGFDVARQDVPSTGGTGTVIALDHSGRLPDGATITLSVATAPAVTPTQAVPASTKQVSAYSAPKAPGKANGKNKGKGKGKKK